MRRAIAAYLLTEKIYESINSEVYRGIRESDGKTFILKVLKQPLPVRITKNIFNTSLLKVEVFSMLCKKRLIVS